MIRHCILVPFLNTVSSFTYPKLNVVFSQPSSGPAMAVVDLDQQNYAQQTVQLLHLPVLWPMLHALTGNYPAQSTCNWFNLFLEKTVKVVSTTRLRISEQEILWKIAKMYGNNLSVYRPACVEMSPHSKIYFSWIGRRSWTVELNICLINLNFCSSCPVARLFMKLKT